MWCNVSSSESIKDYEKGGLKLGGSLLDLMNEGELIKNKIVPPINPLTILFIVL